MKELNFRDLFADEIECRVGVVRDNGFTLLLYKNARVDMALLDEVVGVGNWQREHIILGNDIYCRLGIWNEELKQWVWKTDAGSSGTIEEEKSKASDSFKRAAINFGLGRCLYSAPFIYVYTKTKDGKLTGENPKTSRYSVKVIEYKDYKISRIAIINNETKQVVYSYGYKENKSQNADLPPKTTETQPSETPKEEKGTIASEDLSKIRQIISLYNREESRTKFFQYVEKTYNVRFLEELSLSQGKEVLKVLEK